MPLVTQTANGEQGKIFLLGGITAGQLLGFLVSNPFSTSGKGT